MRKIVIVLAAAAALAVVGPAAADEEHTSCRSWGADFVAAFAQDAGGVGALVSGIATGGAGALAADVAAEHATYCAP
jgi:hypothetical protein